MARVKKSEDSNFTEDMSMADKAKLLRDQINSQMKKVVLQQYSNDNPEARGIPRISSGIPTLDRILGRGPNGYGWARGRFHGVHGPSSAGKSTLVLTSLAEAQKEGVAVLIDSECTYDPAYAAAIGIDIESLLVMNPSCAEEAYDTIETLAKSGIVRMIVVDSLDGLVPRSIVEASADDQFMGLGARVNNRFFAKIPTVLRQHDCTLIVVSQIRHKIGGYGNPETVNGGNGLLYYSSSRVEIRRDDEVTVNGDKVGQIAKVITRKNKASSPQQVAFFRIDWGLGVNKAQGLLELCVTDGIIHKGGAGWFTLPDGTKLQGEEAVLKEINSNEQLKSDLIRRLENGQSEKI
jgi:recombination protein RecA